MNGPKSLKNAKGLRIAIGPDGSSTASSAMLLLAHAGVKASDVRLEPLAGTAAAEALLEGKADMVFQVGSEDSPPIQMLTRSGGNQLLSIENAGSLSSQERPRAMLAPVNAEFEKQFGKPNLNAIRAVK